jgi:hypothetical protein
MRKIINNCTAIVYQDTLEIISLHNVQIYARIAPIVSAPLPQPLNTICEISGKIKEIKNYPFDPMRQVFILFATKDKHELSGSFYIKLPSVFDKKERIYFQLSGALIIEK